MSRTPQQKDQVYAIVRFDDGAREHPFTVKEIVWELVEAEAEVARLNAENASKGCSYSWQTTRLYPRGSSAGSRSRSRESATTTEIGFRNRNRQTVLRDTGLPGSDHLQYIYVLRCEDCSTEYGANGSDIHERRCPQCQGGAAGLAF